MNNKERDQITDILNENGYHGIEIQEYCFDFLRTLIEKDSTLEIIDSLEARMWS